MWSRGSSVTLHAPLASPSFAGSTTSTTKSSFLRPDPNNNVYDVFTLNSMILPVRTNSKDIFFSDFEKCESKSDSDSLSMSLGLLKFRVGRRKTIIGHIGTNVKMEFLGTKSGGVFEALFSSHL